MPCLVFSSSCNFREITEDCLSEDYGHQAPLDLNLIRSNTHGADNQ